MDRVSLFLEFGFGLGLDGVDFRFVFEFVFAVHAIDKQNSLEMIVFVLDGAGKQSATFKFKRLSLFIGCFDVNFGRTRDV